MADLTITVASVASVSSDKSVLTGIAGETITAGQAVYAKTDDNNKLWKGDADTAAQSLLAGIALHGALAGQPLTYQTSGSITIGATMTVGQIYVLSSTAGGIAPVSDYTTGMYGCIIGQATTTTVLKMIPLFYSGVARG